MNNINNNNGAGQSNMINIPTKKKTQGRKKIEMKKIVENNQLQVTFSKRRNGLFKKASELCVLTGAEVAIIVNSPGKRVFAFGHPNVDVMIDRYLTGISHLTDIDTQSSTIPLRDFNEHYADIVKELDLEKKRKEVILHSKKNAEQSWWDIPIEDLELEELELYLSSMEELKNNVLVRADELKMIRSASSFVFDTNNNIQDHTNHLFMMDNDGNPIMVPRDFHHFAQSQIYR